MPTDPSSANQPSPVPLGQAHPNPQRLAQQQHPSSLRFPQHSLHQQQNPHPLPHHQSQHLQRQQYAALTGARNLNPMQTSQPHISQPAPQQPAPQPQQQPLPRQPHRNPLPIPDQSAPQFYPVNGAYVPSYAQQVAAPNQFNYMYPGYYNNMPAGPPQQPGPQPTNTRQYSAAVHGSIPQRQPPSRVQLPQPRKKAILAIVDPDTNEEVKVDNVDVKPAPAPPASTSATQVQIPTRTAKPLELVSDPADEAPPASSTTDDASAKQKSAEPVQPTSSTPAPVKLTENKETPIPEAPPAQREAASAPVVDKNPPPVEPVEKGSDDASDAPKPAATPTEEAQEAPSQTELPEPSSPSGETNGAQTEQAPASESKEEDKQEAAEVEDEQETAPAEEQSVDKTVTDTTTDADKDVPMDTPGDVEAAPQKDLPDDESATQAVPSHDAVEGAKVEDVSTANGVAVNGDVDEVKPDSSPEAMKISADESKDDSAKAPEEESSPSPADADTEASDVQATPRRERTVFGDGERRVYPPDWMHSVRGNVNAKKAAEYIAALSSNNIYKSGAPAAGARQGDPRGSRTMSRGGVGPLSGDPRGKRAFPTPAGPGYMGPGRGLGATGVMGSGGVGSYDFDLGSARSQNPPPVPKGQQGNMRDGRGSRPGSSRDRFDGPNRNGPGPIDPFVNYPPVEKLKITENGWKRNRESDDEVAAKVKQIRSLLNKLTLEKFDKIFKQIIDINISSYEILTGVVKEVFEKALFEPKFSGMYAELCVRLDVSTREMLRQSNIIDSNGKLVFFRNILLNNCREEFTRFALEGESPDDGKEGENKGDDESAEKDGDAAKLTAEEKEAKRRAAKEEADLKATKAKRRMLANVRFIGELFLKDLLKEHIIHRQCIQKLLAIGIEKREEDVLEALCKLLSKTGAKLSMNKDAITHIDGYFKPLEVMSRDHTLPARVRFMLQDLIEQRANGWKVRREEVGAKTIAEIKKDIEKEERAKAEAQAAARERRPRGGSMHSRDRGAQFQPRVAMTMASRPKGGSGISRSTAMLEKHANRAPGSVGSSFQGVRLGPGGSKANSASSGSSGPSLRPGGSRYGALAGLEPREISPTGQSNDARRSIGVRKGLTARRQGAMPKQEPVETKPKLMDPNALRTRTRGIVEEYWSIEMLKEAKECIEQEIPSPNYAKLVEEAVRISLDGKISQRDKSIPLFIGLIEETISRKDFVTGFSAVVSQLSDIEMDDPRASEFLAKYIGAVAATKKLGQEDDATFGLGFLNDCLSEIGDPKRASKLVVAIFAALYKNLSELVPDEDERKRTVQKALQDLDIDLAGNMSAWNPMRGISVLEDMLKDNGVPFLVPLLPIEKRLTESLAGGASGKEVEGILASSGFSKEQLRTDAFMKMVIRISLDWLFMNPPSSIKETFGSTIGKPLVRVFGSEVPRDVQMSAVLMTQELIVKNMDILPPHKEGDTDKPGAIAFEALYDADVVEEETFLKWRDDTGKSTKVVGKEKMIMQTSGFFQWLVTAEVEE